MENRQSTIKVVLTVRADQKLEQTGNKEPRRLKRLEGSVFSHVRAGNLFAEEPRRARLCPVRAHRTGTSSGVAGSLTHGSWKGRSLRKTNVDPTGDGGGQVPAQIIHTHARRWKKLQVQRKLALRPFQADLCRKTTPPLPKTLLALKRPGWKEKTVASWHQILLSLEVVPEQMGGGVGWGQEDGGLRRALS